MPIVISGLCQAQPPTFVGAAKCQPCHPAQFAQQSRSGHARALSRAARHTLASQFSTHSEWRRTPNYRFQFSWGAQPGVQAFDFVRRESLELPLEWAFGSGNHAVTFVSQVEREVYLEHGFSYYPSAKTFDFTPGHDRIPTNSLPVAMGVLHKVSDPNGIKRCFECHSTGPPRISGEGVIAPFEAGIRCEVCHGPGSRHVASAGKVHNPRRFSPDELNKFCGTCHRFPGRNFVVNWNASWNVRHQPPYLRESRCFQKGAGTLSCLTCHDPHNALVRNDAFYSAKCKSCHAAGPAAAPRACLEVRRPNCRRCHMPAVAVTPRLTFANHWIGIYAEGQTLKPLGSQNEPGLSEER